MNLFEVKLIFMAVIALITLLTTTTEVNCIKDADQKFVKLEKIVDDSIESFSEEAYSPQLPIDEIKKHQKYDPSYESIEERRNIRSVKSTSSQSHWKSRSSNRADGTESDQRCGADYIKVCCDTGTEVEACECRCGAVKTETNRAAPYGCPAGLGSFTNNRPTLVPKSEGDGDDTSKGTRLTYFMLSLSYVTPTTYLLGVTVCLICFFLAAN